MARRERAERRRSVAAVEPRRAQVRIASEGQHATRRFAAHRHERYGYGPVATRRVVEAPARHPLAGFRREGWGPLLRGSREERIADAQARGFIVLRARTLRGPDGYVTRRYTDYDLDED